MFIFDDLLYRSLRHHLPARLAGARAHFDDVVGGGEDVRVVVDEEDGVAVGDEVVHDTRKALDVVGVQADGGFIQYI